MSLDVNTEFSVEEKISILMEQSSPEEFKEKWEEYRKDIKLIDLLLHEDDFLGSIDAKEEKDDEHIFTDIIAKTTFNELRSLVTTGEFQGKSVLWLLCYYSDFHPNFSTKILKKYMSEISLDMMLENALMGRYPLGCLADQGLLKVVLTILMKKPGILSNEILHFQPVVITESAELEASLYAYLETEGFMGLVEARNDFFNKMENLRNNLDRDKAEIDAFINAAMEAQERGYETACFEAGEFLTEIDEYSAAIDVLIAVPENTAKYEAARSLKYFNLVELESSPTAQLFCLTKALKHALKINNIDERNKRIREIGSFHVGRPLKEYEIMQTQESLVKPYLGLFRQWDRLKMEDTMHVEKNYSSASLNNPGNFGS